MNLGLWVCERFRGGGFDCGRNPFVVDRSFHARAGEGLARRDTVSSC